MKLMEIFPVNEERIIAAMKNGESRAIFKNPTEEELNKIAMNGIVRGVMTPQNFIGYDFRNIDQRHLPDLHGVAVTVYLGAGNSIAAIILAPYINLTQAQFEKAVRDNQYFKSFNISKILVNTDEAE